jgi:hypothetical protein
MNSLQKGLITYLLCKYVRYLLMYEYLNSLYAPEHA